jgi:thiamine-phosphate pyrophosphorylase
MPLLYYITERCSSGLPILRQIELAIRAGVDLIQIREKDLPARELFALCTKTRALSRNTRTRILVNDRLDIAIAAELDGIHLGQQSLLPGVVRERLPQADFLIGVSIHSAVEFRTVEHQGVSFVTLGPIFRTPSKEAYGAPIGLGILSEVCQQARFPVLALGGINRANYMHCLRAGAAGIAAIRLFQDSGTTLARLVNEIKRADRQ